MLALKTICIFSIYPMPDSDKNSRQKIVDKTIGKYNPICNASD